MLKESIAITDIKSIFDKKETKTAYLKTFFDSIGDPSAIERGKKLDEQIISTWDYEKSKTAIRSLYEKSEKYLRGKACKNQIEDALNEWQDLNLGKLKWPFSAMQFDDHVHRINRDSHLSEAEKDAIISSEAVRFRRIKDINAMRNDYIEYLVFQNELIIPTFGNKRGTDFYIDGEPYDQKVSRSIGKKFINAYPTSYRETAIAHPELVAKSLYENQDESRFGDEPRLLIVYLDNDITSDDIERQLKHIDFSAPLSIDFAYTHSKSETITHHTKCFVILLHHEDI